MLSQDAAQRIGRIGIANHWKKYVVILDNTKNRDVSAEDVQSSDYTVIHTGNNYDRAVKITNFWDERQNVHLVVNDVEKIRFENDVMNALVSNDLTIPVDHELFDGFSKLSATDVINVMTKAAHYRTQIG